MKILEVDDARRRLSLSVKRVEGQELPTREPSDDVVIEVAEPPEDLGAEPPESAAPEAPPEEIAPDEAPPDVRGGSAGEAEEPPVLGEEPPAEEPPAEEPPPTQD